MTQYTFLRMDYYGMHVHTVLPILIHFLYSTVDDKFFCAWPSVDDLNGNKPSHVCSLLEFHQFLHVYMRDYLYNYLYIWLNILPT